jgi:hypothetical protein
MPVHVNPMPVSYATSFGNYPNNKHLSYTLIWGLQASSIDLIIKKFFSLTKYEYLVNKAYVIFWYSTIFSDIYKLTTYLII